MVDQELVKACYRAILGREAESENIVQQTSERLSTAEDLLREFLGSAEFQSRSLQFQSRSLQGAAKQRPSGLKNTDQSLSEARRIDVDVSETQQKALFSRLSAQWRTLGYEDPFWSVLTHDEYRAPHFDENIREEFYSTGVDFARLVDTFCTRNYIGIPRGTCVELGCGVGRITIHLAKRFDKVIAVDISDGNLQHCKTVAENLGVKNIEYLLLRTPDELSAIDYHDFFYSMLTLQHNPPPIQKYQLELILSKLRIGGAFLFQTQTYCPGYSFNVDQYLASPTDIMDMHSLPMHEIFLIIEILRLRIREVVMDSYTGRPGSYSLFGLARDGEPAEAR
jgi:2-polyprenyl-3-methyl-5-hydroxy-6-metoxy-1,4-benzoquinol methylase